MKLHSIAVEERACRKAWQGKRVGTLGWHIHHEILVEQLTESASNRIAYILVNKPPSEQALRLRLFRPVKSKVVAPAQAEYDKVMAAAWAEYDKVMAAAHKKECPGCPWNGRTIFSVKK